MFVRKQPRDEVKIEKTKVPHTVVNKKIAKNIKTEEKPTADAADLKALQKELDKIKAELALSKINGDYSANEKKVISAIKSEIVGQNVDAPVITRSMLIKKYRVSSRYLDSSIKNLISRGDIKREEKQYTSNIKTFSYKLLQ